MTTKKAGGMPEDRYLELKRLLEERQKEVLSEVQGRIRDARSEGHSGKLHEVLDAGESSEADIQEDRREPLRQRGRQDSADKQDDEHAPGHRAKEMLHACGSTMTCPAST